MRVGETRGEEGRSPGDLAAEAYSNRAYPLAEIPFQATLNAQADFAKVKSRSNRGKQTPGSWLSLGPTQAIMPGILTFTGAQYITSGRITALAIRPNCDHSNCRLYVGAAGGGVWRTTNALAGNPKWQFISASFDSNAIGEITVDPTDPTGNTIYVGTGEPNASGDSEAGRGIYKSTDGGTTWTHLASLVTSLTTPLNGTYTGDAFAGRSISQIVIDPASPSTIYVGSTRGVLGVSSVTGGTTSNPPTPRPPFGLFKSTDGGATFSFIWDGNGSIRGVNAVGLDPTDHTIVYAAAYQQGIWRNWAADGGVFKQIFAGTSQGLNIDQSVFALTTLPNTKTRIYVGSGAQGVTVGFPFPQSDISRVWRLDDASALAASLVSGVAPNRLNNPASWHDLSNPTNGTPGYATQNYCTGQCWYDNEIYTPAGHPDTVFVIGSYQYNEYFLRSNSRSILMSTTAGEPDPDNNNRTFTDLSYDASSDVNPNGVHPDQHALVFMPGNPDVWWEARTAASSARAALTRTSPTSARGARSAPRVC